MGYIVDLDVVKFSSIECRLQMSGELSVGWMVEGFLYAQEMCHTARCRVPTVSDVLNLGKLIEPIENAKGFRTCGVQIGRELKMDWENIPGQMVNLMEAVREDRLTPNEFFFEYETVHPFADGNGRTGAILFNWLNGSLYKPVWPDNVFNDPRRTVGYGA